jgi:hypothetical protein
LYSTGTELLFAVTAAEFINLTGGIDNFLLTRIERMAVGADFNLHIFFRCGAGFERVAAAARYIEFFIRWVEFRFHRNYRSYCLQKGAHLTYIPGRGQAQPQQFTRLWISVWVVPTL